MSGPSRERFFLKVLRHSLLVMDETPFVCVEFRYSSEISVRVASTLPEGCMAVSRVIAHAEQGFGG